MGRSITFVSTAVFAGLALAFVEPAESRAQGETFSIIDVHAHLIRGPGRGFDMAAEGAVQMMNAHGIATSIVMPSPRPVRKKPFFNADDFIAAIRKYPGRLLYLGGNSLNILLHGHADPATVTDTVRAKFAKRAHHLIDNGAIGFGEMGGLHISRFDRHPYSFVPADHPLLRDLADIAASRNVPISLHMDALEKEIETPGRLKAFPNNPGRLPATIGDLEKLLAHNPAAKIIWDHGGSDRLGDLTAQTVGRLMDAHPNLYMSLRVTAPRAADTNKLISGRALDPTWRSVLVRHSDRFMIGIDYFYLDPEFRGPRKEFSRRTKVRLQLANAFLSLLQPDIARKIARLNAIRIYRLSPEQAPADIPGLRKPSVSIGDVPGRGGKKRGKKARAGAAKSSGGTCRDGNMAQCKLSCQRGRQRACERLKRGN